MDLAKKLKLYIYNNIRDPRYPISYILYPFFNYNPDEPDCKDYGRFNDFINEGKYLFDIAVDIPSCDLIVFPYQWLPKNNQDQMYQDIVHKVQEDALKYRKKVLIYFCNDSAEEINFENAIIFRTSFYLSKRKSNEFALPAWSIDFLKHYKKNLWVQKNKSFPPSVGYCGYVDYNFESLFDTFKHYANWFLGRKKVWPHETLRGNLIRTLYYSKNILLNFIRRSNFGGALSGDIRTEYVDNIWNSDYSLVTRGMGNFSFRFYEVMSLGRIPLFVDTDCVLPFDQLIDWKRLLLWIDEKQKYKIIPIIRSFHQSINDSDFVKLQMRIREVYTEWLSVTGFHKNIHKIILPLL